MRTPLSSVMGRRRKSLSGERPIFGSGEAERCLGRGARLCWVGVREIFLPRGARCESLSPPAADEGIGYSKRMESQKRGAFLLPGVLCSVVLAGCGSTPPPTYAVQKAHVPACTHASRPIALLPNFPHGFPVPAGTTFVSGRREAGAVVMTGFVPSSSFAQTAAFFRKEVAAAGFTVQYAETDAPRDAEGAYKGHGYAGHWTLEHIPGCAAVRLGVSAQPAR